LPAFTLKGGEVSRYVIGGADLMFPGISIPLEGFPSFEAGQPWAVKVPGNTAPIAVSFSDFLEAGFNPKFKLLELYQLLCSNPMFLAIMHYAGWDHNYE
jgi:translation initiation factor 2D